MKAANAIIIKPNQIGSLSETYATVKLAKENNIVPVVSHRSGETTDETIAHLAVSFGAPMIKTGAHIGGERIAKLNELIRIEEELPNSQKWANSDQILKGERKMAKVAIDYDKCDGADCAECSDVRLLMEVLVLRRRTKSQLTIQKIAAIVKYAWMYVQMNV